MNSSRRVACRCDGCGDSYRYRESEDVIIGPAISKAG